MKALLARRVLASFVVASLVPLSLVALARWGVADARVRFERPALTAVAPLVMLFVALRSARPSSGGRARTLLGDALVGVTVLALSLGVAGLEIGHALDRLTVILVVDRSRSIELVPDADELVRRQSAIATTGMRDDDRIGTVVFGATAATEDPPHDKRERATAQTASVGRDGTDVEAAIRRALAEVPSDSAARIALLSDGVATRGDTMAAAMAAVAAEVPVDVVTLEQREVPDVRVVSVRGPARGEEGEAVDLRVVTSATADAEVWVTVKRDGAVVSRDRARIRAGEDVLRIREKLPEGGLHRYEVELSAIDPSLDGSAEDNAGSTFVRVRGEAAALVLEGDRGRGAFVADALRSASFRVDEGDATRVPIDLAGFAAYDLVVLSDIAAPTLSHGQIEALASYVRDFGGGLLLLGGDRSLGPGGFGKTPIEEVSPVSFDIKQEQRRASLAEVIGIDISGSMGVIVGGRTKLELANEAAARSASLLGPGDLLGVEHVDTEVHWSVALGPVRDPKAIESAIREVAVGGGGIIVPITLEAGYAALASASTDAGKVNLKHMLLFADGDDAEQIQAALPLAAPALRRGITTSVVALGSGHDISDLEQLSKLGGGRFYLIEDASRLPSVFAQETILAARSSLVEKSFHVSVGRSSPATAGIDFAQAPALGGYVVTIPKGRASVLLTGPEGDPILASWPVGVGRAATFTSDLKDRWGAAWTSWPGAARLVAQTGRDLSRKDEDRRVRLESDASSGELHLRATVVGDDGRTDSFRRFTARVAGPDGFSKDVTLEPTGAGSYAADVPLSRQGTYLAVATDEATGEAVGTTGADLERGEELRPTGSDRGLLARLAATTGGQRRDTLEGIFADRRTARLGFEDVTRWLVVSGAAAWLAWVATRRLALPEVVDPARARIRRWWASQRAPVRPTSARERALSELGARAVARRATARGEPRPAPTAAPIAPTPTEPPRATPPAEPRATGSEPAKGAPDATRASTTRAPSSAPTNEPASSSAPRKPGQPGPSTAEILLAKRRKK